MVGLARALLEAPMVFTVKVLVPLPPDEIEIVAGFKLQVGRLCAPVGEPVSAQLKFIVPEYVLPAARVTMAVALAPGVTGDDGLGAEIITWETVMVVVALEPT